MSTFETAALAILAGAAVLLVVLALVWQHEDSKPLDPPLPAPDPPEHQPKHKVNNNPTTRLRPPD